MDLQDLTLIQIVILAAVVLLTIGAIVFFLRKRRTERLRRHFGPEYDRAALSEGGDRRRAEAKLEERTERVKKFNLRPLSAEGRARYTEQWNRVQAHFVDAPAGAVAEADQLLGDIMATCGYPVGDFDQRAADISVEHPVVTQNYRSAHEIALRQGKGQASTEDLRRAMIHYRALFEDLVSHSKDSTVVERKPAIAEDSADYNGETVRVRRG
jgi:hypothetical protein